MSAHTINIVSETLLAFEAERAGMLPDAWIEQYVNGHLSTLQTSYDADQKAKNQAEYDAKVAAYDTAKPTLDKIDALAEAEAKLVQDILDGKVVATDVTAKP